MCHMLDHRVNLVLDALDLNIDCRTVIIILHTLIIGACTYDVSSYNQVSIEIFV